MDPAVLGDFDSGAVELLGQGIPYGGTVEVQIFWSAVAYLKGQERTASHAFHQLPYDGRFVLLLF